MNITSLMFVTYNRLNLTKRMLENLYQTTDVPYRLLIVDNGSIDGTVEFLQELKKTLPEHCVSIDVHFYDKNMGIAIGRNQALKMSDPYQDKWLATLDNDVELPVGWLRECIEIMEANPNHSIGVNMEGVNYPLVQKNGKTFQHKHNGNLGTACMVFDRRLHQLIGFFCMEYNLYGEEDADWGFRSKLVGYHIGYLQNIGNHFGVGELDTGEYRQFKDNCRVNNISNFRKSCYKYMSGEKPIYIPFE